MNIHSHAARSVLNLDRLPDDGVADPHDGRHADRRNRIIDAAVRCIVRSGFHATTVQDVAREAGMSPGNLYRYFPSKDAIVAGLAERDRATVASEFAAIEGSNDFLTNFAAMGQRHFVEESRDRAVLCLAIWSEATRNPAVAAASAAFDEAVLGRIRAMFTRAREEGVLPAALEPDAAARLVCLLADGLYVRRAAAPNFDPAQEVALVMRVIGALLKGAIDLCTPAAEEVAS
ncbi:MAG TPA: TetR/AcrR family transcriptional regulator [Hyphomicrobiales bacterium]|nr:TetR/AcrR family transcriptional regulator [Hyphomicrobiales bacterium]